MKHTYLLLKVQDAGAGGAVFEIIAGFLSGRLQRVAVEGIRSENVRVVSVVPQGNLVGALLFLLCTSDLPLIFEKIPTGYADN